jgi:hypothetical protein
MPISVLRSGPVTDTRLTSDNFLTLGCDGSTRAPVVALRGFRNQRKASAHFDGHVRHVHSQLPVIAFLFTTRRVTEVVKVWICSPAAGRLESRIEEGDKANENEETQKCGRQSAESKAAFRSMERFTGDDSALAKRR